MNRLILRKILATLAFTITGLYTTTDLLGKTTISHTNLDEKTEEIKLTIALQPDDFIDEKFIQFSVDHPDIELSSWQASDKATTHYDPTFKETHKIFNKDFTITLRATNKSANVQTDARLYFNYYLNSEKNIIQEIYPIGQRTQQETALNACIDATENTIHEKTLPQHSVIKTKPSEKTASWAAYLSGLMETTESTPFRILLSLILGILMSLTPCIYPMIPITVGILQAQGSRSFWYNLLLALSYTAGIASTFAFLGLTAAFTGQIFGSIMSSPIFILCVVAVLAYLALSMLGFYDMYTPQFMTTNNATKGGSCSSAFLFGAASGTIASPCLSPGLILLLSIVTALGSKILGFLLLFAFGVGLSLPLLIIGTFSTSLTMLPRAGMWMIEVKKLFGLLLFGMCFYFLNNIMAWHHLLWIISATTLACGIFYLYSVAPYDSRQLRTIKNALGIGLVAGSVFLAFLAFKATYFKETPAPCALIWKRDYQDALNKAQQENKLLFVDGGAPSCSICKIIDRTILSDQSTINELLRFVTVKIDVTESSPVIEELKKRYQIIGAPTIMIIDPKTGDLLRKWGPELYDSTVDAFVNELQTY